MAKKEFPLSLVIRAVDKATEPLRKVNERIKKFTEPVRKLNNSLRAMSVEAGIPRLVTGFKVAGKSARAVGKEALALGAKFTAMAGAAGYALARIVNDAVKAGDDLATLSERVGLSVDAFAQLQFAAGKADVEQSEFNVAMDQFTKRLGEAKAGTGSLLMFLQKVSPALASQIKNATGTEQAFGLMVAAFEKVTDPAKRAALANAAFGRSGMQMGLFLGQGSAAIAEQRALFLRLSGSQEEFAAGAGNLDNALIDLRTAFLGLRNTAAGALFPVLTELAKSLGDLIAGNREKVREFFVDLAKTIGDWVKTGGLERLTTGIYEIGKAAKSLTDSAGGLRNVVGIVAALAAAPLISAIVSLGGSLWKLGGAIIPVVSRAWLLLWPLLIKGAAGIKAGFAFIAPMFASMGAGITSMATAAAPFVAAATGLAAAGFVIYKEWSNLKELFTDFTSPGGLLGTLAEMMKDAQSMNPLSWLGTAGEWWGKNLGITGQQSINVAGSTPAPSSSQAHITVDFNNAPPGARASIDHSSTADVNMSMGYSMAVP
jgi:hypothetical protein